jgi:hypothetical protein
VQLDFLINDGGETFPAGSQALRRSVAGFAVGDGFSQYAICNLGYVGGRKLRAGLQLFFRPESMSPEAFSTALFCLSDMSGTNRVVLSTWRKTGFLDQIFSSNTAAQQGLSARFAANRSQLRERLRRRIVSSDAAPDALRRCISHWDASFAPETMIQVVRHYCEDRFVAFGRSTEGFLLYSYGNNNPAHAMSWYEGSVGKPLRKNLDREYSWFCNESYRAALTQRRPLLEAVDARVLTPNQELRRRYYRIVLPLTSADHSFVVVATVENRDIELCVA